MAYEIASDMSYKIESCFRYIDWTVYYVKGTGEEWLYTRFETSSYNYYFL